MAQPVTQGSRSERTRSAVLEAAEVLFSERGFDGTRLEDIAERVGIRRASIVYYFKDKRELYDAVLASVFGDLHVALSEALGRDDPLPERIEAGVSAWIDFVGRRPTVARIILREVAGATPERQGDVLAYTRPFADLVRREIFDRPDFPDQPLVKVDPVHVASTVAGATVFLVAAMPTLIPDRELDPTSREHLSAHKKEMVRIVRRLLED
ncbi:MAG: TetR/AcrR family transcriptional regulator [Myxococcota bacterium]|nr:TetR/AcrR family transcriptional regulator [Myxococcota bacterium]